MPTEAEIQTQWKNGVACLEDERAFIDDTLFAASGNFDTFVQSFEGQYIPVAVSYTHLRAHET